MKVLLSAYACEPNRGSEPGVGWNMALAMSHYHQVHVLTTAAHKAGIEAELATNPYPNIKVTYVDPGGWVYNWQSPQKLNLGVNLHYYIWQIMAYFRARQLLRTEKFDLAHHVTYVRYYAPSLLPLLPIPFIWGPVGGAEAAPKPFWRDFNWRSRLFEYSRDFVRALGEIDPLVRLAVRKSTLLLAVTGDTAARFVHLGGGDRLQLMSEVSLQTEEIACLGQLLPPSTQPIRFISMGRLLHWKGFHLGLRAFAEANLPDAEFWIVGSGPQERSLKQLARRLNIAHQVRFWGMLPRAEALEKLAQSSVLVHPSLHDSGGWVCLEAMAAGRPVVCLDLGGPGVQVTPATGFKVPATQPIATIAGLAQAMQRLAQDEQLIQQMGRAGKQHVQEHYCWQSREVWLNRLYEQVVQDYALRTYGRPSSPNPFP
jgi:glycosyltransferase involved in cell wall biosynthesis